MKTGYCHIYNHKLPLDSITDRLHIGNRWLGHLGLAMYDNTARVHDPVMPHMLTCDSRAVDYPGHSPFSHCAGNPANLVDRDGNDVTILDGIGHIALLIQQKNGQFAYYSINGNNVYVSGEFSGGKTFNNLGERSFESPQAFLDSDYNTSGGDKTQDDVNGYGYERGYNISTTEEQDQIMSEAFLNAAESPYDLITNNCAIIVQKALNAGGISTQNIDSKSMFKLFSPLQFLYSDSQSTIVPAYVFKSIYEANPDGEFIYKQSN